jgi:hypothetical protein
MEKIHSKAKKKDRNIPYKRDTSEPDMYGVAYGTGEFD